MAIYLRGVGSAPVEVAAGELRADLVVDCHWIDLLNPTNEEVKAVEELLALDIPTKEEMREIESTSRLYCEDAARFMNTPLLINTAEERPELTEVAFILMPKHLITLRERDSASFRNAAQQAQRGGVPAKRDSLFIALLENIVDRQADMLERISKQVDEVSERIFKRYGRSRETERNLREAIYSLGRDGDLIARQRDCIVALSEDLHGGGGDLPAAHAGGQSVWDELRVHARA